MNYFSEGQLAATIGSPISKPPYGMPKSIPLCKSAEEMLKKALVYTEAQKPSVISGSPSWSYDIGRVVAYQDMAAHLEMLIKEAKNETREERCGRSVGIGL